MTELNRLLQRLCEADVEFVIVGGFAAMLHGSSLLTRNLDVCCLLTDGEIDKLRQAFKDLNPVHRFTPQRLSFLENPRPGEPIRNIYLQTDLGPINFLGSIAGVGGYNEVREHSTVFNLFGHKVFVIGIDDLLRGKETLGREKDLLAVKELRAIIEKNGN
ncbi:MAG: nucleotidyltransferase [Gammaproteobacteria bacterium]